MQCIVIRKKRTINCDILYSAIEVDMLMELMKFSRNIWVDITNFFFIKMLTK